MSEPDEYRPMPDREIRKHVEAWGIDALRNPPRAHPVIKFCSDAFMIIFWGVSILMFLIGIVYGFILLIRSLL